MIGLLTGLHVLIAIVLILAVLLQSAKGSDLAGAFGGMGSQTAFGPRGTATFLSKATVVLAILFMLTSITLAIMGNQIRGAGGPSVLSDEPAGATAPAAPATTPAGTPTPAATPAPGATPAPAGGAETTGTNPSPDVNVQVVPAPEGAPATETPAPEPPAQPAGQ